MAADRHPASGTAPKTKIAVALTSCIRWDRFATDVPVQWGGAGVKPGSVVKQKWNGTVRATTAASANGAYQGAYVIRRPSSFNTVSVDGILLDRLSTITFGSAIDCTPAALAGAAPGRTVTITYGY